jgi:methyltransferase (TIGR00027 family)
MCTSSNDTSDDVNGADPDPAIVDPVGATSRLTAAARARETEHSDRLFADPHAAELAGPQGLAALDRHNAARSGGAPLKANPVFAVRTRFSDDFLMAETTQRRARQVVLLAAGLDTRAFRLRWPPNVELYELDQPEVLAYKDAMLRSRRAEPTCERKVAPVDLQEQWAPALLTAGYRPGKPAAWLAEGLTFYLDESAVHRLFTDIATLASPGDGLGTDFVSAPPSGVETLVGFMTDDPTPLLRECGWDAEQYDYDVEGERLGRPWPYPERPQGCMTIARRR